VIATARIEAADSIHGPPRRPSARPVARGRWSASLALFAVCAVVPALATSALVLGGALLALAAASGALDVAINAEGVRAEGAPGRPLMSPAHTRRRSWSRASSPARCARPAPGRRGLRPGRSGARALRACSARAPVCARCCTCRARWRCWPATALASFIENAWQRRSAVRLETTLGAAAGLAALGPALFSSAAAAGRVAGASRSRSPESRSRDSGRRCARRGCSASPGRRADAAVRGSAVSIVTTIAYLGFLVGPAAVGLLADAASLRAALAAVGELALALAALVRLAPVP
jgi:hypothetical protein